MQSTYTDMAKVYTSTRGIDELRIKAHAHDPAALPAVAKQIEGVFLQMVLKSMRDASAALRSDFLNSNDMDFYQEMYQQQLALHLSDQGVGLSDVIIRQLSKYDKSTDNKPAANTTTELATKSLRYTPVQAIGAQQEQTQQFTQQQDKPQDNAVLIAAQKSAQKSKRFQSRQAFIDELLPYAKKAATALGLDPKLLLAQAALETGWGRAMVEDESGNNSYNLFGIKSHAWSGDSMTAMTHEFKQGEMQSELSAFRGYDSYAESFDDYLTFLRSNPRYEKALANTQDNALFVQELQRAGYATDPYYAQKILRLLNSPILQDMAL